MQVHYLRKYTHDRHKTADDKPYGGGAGMVMKPEPIFECLDDVLGTGKRRKKACVVLLEPQGKPLSPKIAQQLARKERLVLLAGHYEGVDYRVRQKLVDEEISIGDFITMGGEAPALCLIEAVSRFIPGVLGNKESLKHESFQDGMLEYPQYTRPREYRGMKVPDVLVSGNHQDVRAWREKEAEKRTRAVRPDLYQKLIAKKKRKKRG